MTDRTEGTIAPGAGTAAVPIEVEVAGDRHPGIGEYADKRLRAALRVAHEPVLHVWVRITHHGDPAVARPVVARVNVDVNGRTVHARATGVTGPEAVDLLHDRLRRRLERDRRRGGAHWEDLRGHPAAGHVGGRVDGSSTGGPPSRLPVEEREVVRRVSVTPHRCGVDEAVFDMDTMGYDAHLFTEERSGQDSVLYRDPARGLRLAQVEPRPDELAPFVTPLTVGAGPAPVLDVTAAVEQMELWNRPFLFFVDAGCGRGVLLHRRHDGHYGLVVPAE